MAEHLERQIASDPDFELMAPRQLSLLNFRYAPAGADDLDSVNARLVNAINDEGVTYLTQNIINGSYSIRFQIGQTLSEQKHVDTAWQRVRELAERVRSE